MLSYPVRIALIAALGGFLFGFETAVISGAEKTIQELWQLGSFWQGFTVASSLIGTVIGSIIAAAPAKKYGRKKVLMAIAILYLLSAIGCASTSIWILFITFRFLGGIAVGASSVVGPMYISEIAPARIRGRLVTTTSFSAAAKASAGQMRRYEPHPVWSEGQTTTFIFLTSFRFVVLDSDRIEQTE